VPAPILIVDDEANMRRAVSRTLKAEGYATLEAESAERALEVLDRERVALVLTDVSMPGMSGLELLERLHAMDDPPPTVMMSGEATTARAVRAVQLGALDFLDKPFEHDRLRITVRNALRFTRLSAAHETLKAEVSARAEIVGETPPMRHLRALIAKVAPSDGRVLILGENGTGKELVASAIHEGSARRDGPFVKLNCASVPENLVESELFGHEKGAFTGAVDSRKGRFEMADGGTLFLDEIGDMPAPMQAKLLRVLQEGTFERVGGGRTFHVDVRVVAATNRDLHELVDTGEFRQDLLYRLEVVTLEVPPLRERPGDIGALAAHFLRDVGPRNGWANLRLSPEALEVIQQHDYPGNVRELANICERIAILASNEEVGADEIGRYLPRGRGSVAQGAPAAYRRGVPLKDLMSEAEKALLEAAIADHDGNKPDAAESLSVDRSFFYKKCRTHGID